MSEVSAALSPTGDSDEQKPVVIQVSDLKKAFRRGRIQAVKGVSFDIGKGRVFGLIGPDGAGKTSILQILAGVLSANGGDATVGGIDVLKRPEEVKARIGYMPQGLGLNLYDSLTVSENIEFFRDLRELPQARFQDNLKRLLQMTRLEPFLNRAAGKLSGGMRQKLALICTLIHLPDILLLDEPTTGVDPISRRDFWTIIHELVTSRKTTVLLTTSYMDEAERCHDVALMHEGVFIAQGAPDELTKSLAEQLMAVASAAPGRVLSTLRGWPGAESVALFGAEVHVLLKATSQDLETRLHQMGMDDANVRAITPGLEDLFVHKLAKQKIQRTESEGVGEKIVTPHHLKAIPIMAKDLTCRFGDFVAVDSVNLVVNHGEIFGLLGPNGAGKTTLIKMLCGLLSPSSGSAEVAGYDTWRDRRPLRHRIGYMSQRFSLYRDLTVCANLELYAGLFGLSSERRTHRINTLLPELGLEDYRERITHSLPLGLRQRLALACALLHEPELLFLDEPTSGVDPVARRQFWDSVHLMAQMGDVTVLVSTHYMDEAEHCDRLGLMQQGRLIASGRPQELKEEAEAHGGPLVVVHAADFALAFQCLNKQFPQAMLYGRRIQWQSDHPTDDQDLAKALLADIGLQAEIYTQGLSMDETFISFMTKAG
jgi:ABC-2 type transport system ATP-binding protein